MSLFMQMAPTIYSWSSFSEEKKLNFNGTLVVVDGFAVLIDPVEMTPEQVQEVSTLGLPNDILITNKDHKRAALAVSESFADIPLWIHEADKELLGIAKAKTFTDRDSLPLDLVPIHLEHFKSPGETAFYLEKDNGIMILGDAVIGKPAGSLSLLPTSKVKDPLKACGSLNKLLKYKFDTLILGDGESILSNAHDVLSKFIAHHI